MSSFLYGLMIFLFVFLFIFYVVMYPATNSKSSSEMQTAYYILIVPNSFKVLSSFSFIGLLIVVPLYYRSRLHKPAILLFEEKSVLITGKKISIDIPKRHIKTVYCNDLKNAFGEPKEKLQVVIRQNTHKNTTFRLKHYEQGGELIDVLSTLENVEIVGYQNEMLGDHQEDE
ncbi:hypothetical protein [Flavihumibacter cheonanensis]|uniref:hypothetical protein n=1 Tax=Flavihumibacter cheonanensis TaxID=1442385 RepID=UPI001EF83BFD|nr:hypothetical protein [Flavihumibacter cheonanensis]